MSTASSEEPTEAAPDPSAEFRGHPGWWARLAGEALDLETLAESVRLPALEVRQFDGRYYLWMNDFQAATSEQSDEVERRAEEIIRVLNGAARLEHGNSHEVHVDAATWVHSDGRIENFVHLSATVEGRGRFTATVTVAGQPQPVLPPPSLIAAVVEKGLADADAEQALRIFGRDDVDYRDLYYVFEKAEEALGGDMFAAGTVTQAEVRRFKHTAQSPTALGDASRHGRERHPPPANPMPFADARDLIGRVLRVWLIQSGNT